MASLLKKFLFTATLTTVMLGAVGLFGTTAQAQTPESPVSLPIASDYTMACAGYIAAGPASEDIQIVGADREAEHDMYADGDIVYLNKGRGSNIQLGAEYQIVRNIGPVKDFKGGKVVGNLVYELGLLRIVALQDNTATAQIKVACRPISFGDAAIPYDKKVSPTPRPYKPLSLAGIPTGRTSGQILAAPDNREMLSQNDVVYLNVGADNGVKVGDYLTIYRRLGSDTVTKFRDDRVGSPRRGDYSSDRYNSRDNTSIATVTKPKPKIIEQVPRNTLPRALIGEVVIVRVEANAATAIITRTTREAYPGDFVELQ